MKAYTILGIDTSSPICAVALAHGSTVLWEKNSNDQLRHGEEVFVSINDGLKQHGLHWDAIDIIACGVGPGSFTGLRVGLAAVKGIVSAHPCKKIIGISSLDIIARNNIPDTECAVIVDARQERLYTAWYRVSSGTWVKKGSERLENCHSLCARIKRRKKPLTVCGDALASCGHVLKDECGSHIVVTPETAWYPRGAHIIACAQPYIIAKKFLLPTALKPQYLWIAPLKKMHKKRNGK